MTSATSSYFAPRLATLKQIGLSTLSWPLVLGGLALALPRVAPLEAPVDRVLLVVSWLGAPALVLMVMIMSCMRLMEADPRAEDPFAGVESRRFQVNQRVVQNTLEQGAFFVPALLALATRIDPAHTYLLPAMVLTWSLGRVAFWVGYRLDPHYRSIGFGWSQNTGLLALGWLLFTLV